MERKYFLLSIMFLGALFVLPIILIYGNIWSIPGAIIPDQSSGDIIARNNNYWAFNNDDILKYNLKTTIKTDGYNSNFSAKIYNKLYLLDLDDDRDSFPELFSIFSSFNGNTATSNAIRLMMNFNFACPKNTSIRNTTTFSSDLIYQLSLLETYANHYRNGEEKSPSFSFDLVQNIYSEFDTTYMNYNPLELINLNNERPNSQGLKFSHKIPLPSYAIKGLANLSQMGEFSFLANPQNNQGKFLIGLTDEYNANPFMSEGIILRINNQTLEFMNNGTWNSLCSLLNQLNYIHVEYNNGLHTANLIYHGSSYPFNYSMASTILNTLYLGFQEGAVNAQMILDDFSFDFTNPILSPSQTDLNANAFSEIGRLFNAFYLPQFLNYSRLIEVLIYIGQLFNIPNWISYSLEGDSFTLEIKSAQVSAFFNNLIQNDFENALFNLNDIQKWEVKSTWNTTIGLMTNYQIQYQTSTFSATNIISFDQYSKGNGNYSSSNDLLTFTPYLLTKTMY